MQKHIAQKISPLGSLNALNVNLQAHAWITTWSGYATVLNLLFSLSLSLFQRRFFTRKVVHNRAMAQCCK